jgi:acylphosphatase
MPADLKAVMVRVTGRVQGVGFRDWTQTEASRLGLTGWVRNEADGSVGVLLVGDAATVGTMIERLHEGPSYARVETVTQDVVDIAGPPVGFRVTR